MRRRILAALLLWPGVLLAAAEGAAIVNATPQELVAAVERASHTEGYRLRATLSPADTKPAPALRVMMAGSIDARQRRLLIRALAPDTWRDHSVILDSGPGPMLKAVAYASREDTAGQAADAHTPLFGSGLVAWDFLGLWWTWPAQVRIREDRILGRDCVVIDSRGGHGPVARVRSWISPDLRMPLRVEFYSAQGALLRTIRVEKVFRRTDGAGAARSMLLTDAAGAAQRFEIYNGEDGVALAPEVFTARGEAERNERQVSP